MPSDATKFEFVEITNCSQWNPGLPFFYDGIKLLFVSEQGSAMSVVGRQQDGAIRMEVVAQIK